MQPMPFHMPDKNGGISVNVPKMGEHISLQHRSIVIMLRTFFLTDVLLANVKLLYLRLLFQNWETDKMHCFAVEPVSPRWTVVLCK